MRFRNPAFVAMSAVLIAFTCNIARAEVADLGLEKLAAMATHIFAGKLVKIYSVVETSAEWETTYSVAEVQIGTVEKGTCVAKLVYLRFWRRKYRGKGEAPDGSYGYRNIPEVGSQVRAYVREMEDGGYDVVLPNGISQVAAPAKDQKK
jgi:hypothetical protein